MAKLTIINDGMGEIRVHKAGCRDIARAPRGSSIWTIDAACLRDVTMDIYDGFEDMEVDGSNWADFAGDIKVLPCAGKLPDEAPTD